MGLGYDGEEIACEFLSNSSYKILARNYHSRFGEIDIIAKDKNCLVFVEVKTRSSKSYGTPLEAITKSKLSKLIKTSQFYISQNKLGDIDYRFDAIEVMFDGHSHEVNHLKSITI